MNKILVVHGPNLNMLGTREPDVYGSISLTEINSRMKELGKELDIEIEAYQSNSEGVLVSRIQSGDFEMLIINPAAYTHTSVAIRDAIAAVARPAIEVHLSNVYQREEFRHHSYIAPVCIGQIAGFGPDSYMLALRAARAYFDSESKKKEQADKKRK